MSSNPSLSLNPLLGILSCCLMPHSHLTILISARWSATSFSFLTGQISLPCNILLCTQLLYNLPLTFNDTSLLVGSGAYCLNLFHPVRRNAHTQPFYGCLDSVRDNPGEPVPEETFTHSHPSWSSNIPICFLHLLRSMASYLFNPRALQSFSTIPLQFFFGLYLGLAPSTSYSIHFFSQSLCSFCSTCPYHCNLFCCSTEIMSSNPSLSLNSLLGTLSCSFTSHIHFTSSEKNQLIMQYSDKLVFLLDYLKLDDSFSR